MTFDRGVSVLEFNSSLLLFPELTHAIKTAGVLQVW
jgi:hypothetical protein